MQDYRPGSVITAVIQTELPRINTMEDSSKFDPELPGPPQSAGCAGPIIGILGAICCITAMLVCGEMFANKPKPNAIEGNILPPGSFSLGHSLFVLVLGFGGMAVGITLSVTGLVLSLVGLSKPNRENAYLGIICSLAGPAIFAMFIVFIVFFAK